MESQCICQLWYFTRLQQLCTHCQVFLKLLQRFLYSPLLWKIDLMWFFCSRQSVEKQIQKLELGVLLNCWKCRWSSITSEDKAAPLGTGSGMHCASIFLGAIFGSHTGRPPPFFPWWSQSANTSVDDAEFSLSRETVGGFYQTDGCDYQFCVSKLWNGTWVELCCTSKASTKYEDFPLYSKPQHHT
jgi:hypothetical protein